MMCNPTCFSLSLGFQKTESQIYYAHTICLVQVLDSAYQFLPPGELYSLIPNCFICLVFGPKLLKDPFEVGRVLP